MKKKFLFLLLLIFNTVFSQNQLPIIPYPSQVELGSGSFVLNDKTTIQADENSFEAKYLKEIIKSKSGLDLSISEVYSSNSIQLIMKLPDTINFDKEQYELSVSNNKITITAFSNQGIFYGIQTLLQLIPSDKKNEISIPFLQINDYSKYKWRGMHLDVSRHFFP
ncbi:MAG: glycoside hydrolase family 20 zincin-like fold domain-containing protein, partial [Flavobacterium sp.]